MQVNEHPRLGWLLWLSPATICSLPIGAYLILYPPAVITMLNFVHHSLTFKHFITTYVHLETILLVSFGAETVLAPTPPFHSPPGQTTFPSLLCSRYSHVTELWPMGCGQGWSYPSEVWTPQISVWSSVLSLPLDQMSNMHLWLWMLRADDPQPGSLNDCVDHPLKVLLSSNTLSLWNLGSACFSRSVP